MSVNNNHVRRPPFQEKTNLPQRFDVLGGLFFHFRHPNATATQQRLGFHLAQLVQMVKHGCAAARKVGEVGEVEEVEEVEISIVA